MTKLEEARKTWVGKSDEWIYERLANELTDKVSEIHSLLKQQKMNKRFLTADAAFHYYYTALNEIESGENGTSRFKDVGFYITAPEANLITREYRKWSEKYADREFKWYMSGNRSVSELKKYAPIWDKMHSGDDLVNSNYGNLWQENDQLEKCIQQIKNEGDSGKGGRQIWLTLFDGKRKDQYEFDTPCTLNIGFEVENGELNMRVLMRSNDIWYGFCNDQYCFSQLMKIVATRTGLVMGWYYHYAADLHLYDANRGK